MLVARGENIDAASLCFHVFDVSRYLNFIVEIEHEIKMTWSAQI